MMNENEKKKTYFSIRCDDPTRRRIIERYLKFCAHHNIKMSLSEYLARTACGDIGDETKERE